MASPVREGWGSVVSPLAGSGAGGGASGVPCEWGLWEFCCVPDEEGLRVVVVSVLFPGGGCLWCPLRRVLGRVRVGSYRRVWGGSMVSHRAARGLSRVPRSFFLAGDRQ